MWKKAKPKTRFSRETSRSLTAEDYLLQQMSLRYLVDQSLSISEVAKKLNTTPAKIKTFLEDSSFKEELSSRIERVVGVDENYRKSQAQISLLHIYEEIRRREAEDELKNVPLRDLHRMLIDFQKELRLDTPGAFTSKVGVADLTNLQDRYKESLSAKILQKKKEIPLPNKELLELERKEASEDLEEGGISESRELRFVSSEYSSKEDYGSGIRRTSSL